MSSARRVVVTGMGAVTPLGMDVETLWRRAVAGQGGIGRIRAFDASGYRSPCGAEVDGAALASALEARGIRPIDRTGDMALLAADEALRAAGLVDGPPPYRPRPAAAIFGTGNGSSRSLYKTFDAFFHGGPRQVRPTAIPRCMINALSSHVSLRFALTGPNYTVSSACSSAAVALGIGCRMIRDGAADLALCGGAECLFDPFVYAAWDNLGVLSRQTDPSRACRPFDSGRDGFVLGEGAGALVLEGLDHASGRGARPLAEFLGFGEGSDAHHLTRPDPEGQARCIRAALADAGLAPREVGFVNAHATGTRVTDAVEARAIRAALGDAAAAIPVGSSKSLVGHMIGASAAVETILTIAGLSRGLVPPNLGLEQPDPDCDLCLVGREAQPLEAAVALKHSFGFGGNNAVLVVRRWEE